MFHDGLSVHKQIRALRILRRFKWVRLLNEGWCSYLNPIEYFIGMVKRHYYKQKIAIGANPLMQEDGSNLNEIHLEQLIHQAFAHYTDYNLNKVVDKCTYELI